jgi:hypothetical protein
LSGSVPGTRRLDHQRALTTLNFYAQAVPGGDAHAAESLEALRG